MGPDQKRWGRATHQLPPGRHGLSRDFVAANQRARILDAVADVAGLAGYDALSVESVSASAGVSRRTFYDHFKSKDDAFLSAYDAISGELLVRVQRAYMKSSSFAEGVYACLKEFLDYVAAEPRYADMCIVEVLAAGPEAIARRDAVMRRLAAVLHEGAETIANGVHPPPLVSETVIGGIYEVVYMRVLRGEAADVPELLSDLAYSIMLPYVGHDAARREIERLRAAAPTTEARGSSSASAESNAA
jgi:AcrR family transcriptional regulator